VESLTGQNLLCPHCAQEFFATLPDTNSQIILPEKLPFFKFGRKKILTEKLQELIADGELSEQDDQTLQKTASLLGLDQSDLDELTKKSFLNEFNSIQKRIEKAWQLSDEDLDEIEVLKRKYGVKHFTMEGNGIVFRQIYLLEAKGELPNPIDADLLLDSKEPAYYGVGSTWQQTRVRNHGYSGTSISVPTGIKGVRFRFGQYNPIKTEELTPLASGTLWVTAKRLIFQGDRRNTKVDHKKILDTEIFLDALRVEKSTGKPDYFSMKAVQARYITALIGALKG